MNKSDWITLFEKHGIDYVLSGKNVGSGNIGIKCPFCSDDPSHHLNIEPSKGMFFCFRDESHSGRYPFKLVKELIGANEARIFCQNEGQKTADELDTLLGNINAPQAKIHASGTIVVPGRDYDCRTDGAFRNYLLSRGIEKEDLLDFITENDLKVCGEGVYADRWIIPYQTMDGKKIITFTGRAIYKNAFLRYLSPSNEEGLAPNRYIWLTIKHCGGTINHGTLNLLEGPFDKVKAAFYDGRWFGCLSTNRVSDSQIQQLYNLKREGILKKIVLIMDKDQVDNRLLVQMRLQDSLGLPVLLGTINKQWKDAGEVPSVYLIKRKWFMIES